MQEPGSCKIVTRKAKIQNDLILMENAQDNKKSFRSLEHKKDQVLEGDRMNRTS